MYLFNNCGTNGGAHLNYRDIYFYMSDILIHVNIVLRQIFIILCLCVCRDVQKQKALVKNESLLPILSGETLQHVAAQNSF